MKKLMEKLMIVTIALLLMVPMASATSISVGDQIKLSPEIGNANSGGAFYVDKVGDSQGVLFDTFCLERNETLNYNTAYYVGSITDSAVAGGYSGGNPDPISSATAYLYYEWATGQIAHTATNANDLQLAIWSLEGEITTAHPLTLTAGANAFISSAANANGFYGVQVMNLYGNYSATTGYCNNKQSQLVYNAVPEPASLLLFGLGLLGIAGIRRKIKK